MKSEVRALRDVVFGLRQFGVLLKLAACLQAMFIWLSTPPPGAENCVTSTEDQSYSGSYTVITL
jgi:hypothetical protein